MLASMDTCPAARIRRSSPRCSGRSLRRTNAAPRFSPYAQRTTLIQHRRIAAVPRPRLVQDCHINLARKPVNLTQQVMNPGQGSVFLALRADRHEIAHRDCADSVGRSSRGCWSQVDSDVQTGIDRLA